MNVTCIENSQLCFCYGGILFCLFHFFCYF
jgi:hypothetical protein